MEFVFSEEEIRLSKVVDGNLPTVHSQYVAIKNFR